MKYQNEATPGMDIGWSMGANSGTRIQGNCAGGVRKRLKLLALRRRAIAAALVTCILLAPSPSYSRPIPNRDDRVELELSALGNHGDKIARAREHTLEILQHENACTAWFQESVSDPAEVFRSLHFELEEKGPSYVYGMRDSARGQLIKQPWAARSTEYAGRNSTILLNVNGSFFSQISPVMQLDPSGALARPAGFHRLAIASFRGDSPEAQITILLHELGHVVGRLPEDGDSWDGRSSQNTAEVLRHCKIETQTVAHGTSRGRT